MALNRSRLYEVMHTFLTRYIIHKSKKGYGHIGSNSYVHTPSISGKGQHNIFIGDNVIVDWNSVMYADSAKLVIKDEAGIAVGFTAITGNHKGQVGEFFKAAGNDNLQGKDITIEEDVWVGANVTLLAGSVIGRGAIIGAGSVVAGKHVPPYSIVMGNPCKVVGFRFRPDEIIEHEEKLYKEVDRLPLSLLEDNYQKFFLSRLKEIREFTSL